jgi:hypothetical protein
MGVRVAVPNKTRPLLINRFHDRKRLNLLPIIHQARPQPKKPAHRQPALKPSEMPPPFSALTTQSLSRHPIAFLLRHPLRRTPIRIVRHTNLVLSHRRLNPAGRENLTGGVKRCSRVHDRLPPPGVCVRSDEPS